MKKYLTKITTSGVICAMLFVSFIAPAMVSAAGTFGSGIVFSTSSTSGASASVSSSESTTCDFSVDRTVIITGEGITLNWSTSGFDNIAIDGVPVSGDSGSKEIVSLLVSTIFTLEAVSDGGSSCTQQVSVTCLPPEVPDECKLVVEKTVDKSSAIPGDVLTYTIVVSNVGEADCTGHGVLIEDVIDVNVNYLSYFITGNFSAGYDGKAVYTASDRTLHFNGETLEPGEAGTITWTGEVVSPTQCGDFEVENQAKATAKELDDFQTWAYSQTVKTMIDNDCEVAPTCTIDPRTQVVAYGETASFDWTTENAQTATLTDFGNVSLNGTQVTGPLFSSISYTLTATNVNLQVDCVTDVIVGDPDPSCDLFTASPNAIVVGESTVLTWETTAATSVSIDNGVGAVALDGSATVSPGSNMTYKLTAVGVGSTTISCEVPVTVSEDSIPVCESFTAIPGSLAVGGGDVTLDWEVSAASSVNIDPLIGAVGLIGSQVVSLTDSTTFTLVATDVDGDITSCTVPVIVPDPEPELTCVDNVNFSASDTSIRRGENSTLTWSTNDVDSVSISDINVTTLNGSQSVSPANDITYILTAIRGSETVACPLPIKVTSGGGGGGGSSPRCELTISDEKINSGEEIIIEWDTSKATGVTLTDDRGKELFTTDDFLAKDKADYYDGSIKLKPKRDTEYLLVATRGSRDVECEVFVKVKDDIVILQTRDQQPLVASISLSQVPYTGFEAGPFMTVVFYVVLAAWSLYMAYMLVFRKELAVNAGSVINKYPIEIVDQKVSKKEEVKQSVVFTPVSVTDSVAKLSVPADLPVAATVIDQESIVNESEVDNGSRVTSESVTTLEDKAHKQKALLSSGAIRHFVAVTNTETERNDAIDKLIKEAKKRYPLEDGWIVISESRMEDLCIECQIDSGVSDSLLFTPTVIPEGSGSLAEAIVTGNIVAAYQMIGKRPMFSLADAASDLDSVYRSRQGESVAISEMLKTETEKLSDDQIKNMIVALTSALDGTYVDEASTVKMSIMRAVKEAA